MLGLYFIFVTVMSLFLAMIWSKEGALNFIIKFVLWIEFIVSLLVTLNHFGVLLFGKIPLV